MTTDENVERLMKRCQIGVGGRNALDEMHSILAECYGTLGVLMSERDALRAQQNEILSVVECIAEAPPPSDSDTLLVRRVKEMAQRIMELERSRE